MVVIESKRINPQSHIQRTCMYIHSNLSTMTIITGICMYNLHVHVHVHAPMYTCTEHVHVHVYIHTYSTCPAHEHAQADLVDVSPVLSVVVESLPQHTHH